MRIELPETLSAFIADGYWAIVPQSWAQKLSKRSSLCVTTCVDAPPSRSIYAVRRNAPQTPLVSDFIAILHEEMRIKADGEAGERTTLTTTASACKETA